MYYEESTRLTTSNPRHKVAIRALDRQIAHAFTSDRLGFTELTLLAHKAEEPIADIKLLMDSYEHNSVVRRYDQLLCLCGQIYDPNDGKCISCDSPITDAIANGNICYATLKPPQEPAFNPKLQNVSSEIFISYRHSDTATLAADIFYLLRSIGKTIFLDNSNIPPGDGAERDFLRGASHAGHFIFLVSTNYFSSEFCKKEIAHAARSGHRLIRINIPPTPDAPADMSWVDRPNWLHQKGDGQGLQKLLEEELLASLQTPPTTGVDLRRDGCHYLLSEMSAGEINEIWNRLPWLIDNYQLAVSRLENIRLILSEAKGNRLTQLCSILAPL